VEQVKSLRARKLYRAKVRFSQEVEEGELARAAAGLVGEIAQRTPIRVSHRRADLVRLRRVFQVKTRYLSPSEAELEILCDGGLYVKELISGDEGRTDPSLAGLLGVPAQVVELDVLEVLDDLPPPDQGTSVPGGQNHEPEL
jgi:tRNA pseudouridine synthase 10